MSLSKVCPTISSPSNLPKPANLFGAAAILSKENYSEYTFIFMHKEAKQSGVLQPTFLTALEKDGVKISWEVAKSCLVVGCKAKIDVTQCKPASLTSKWLVFGLYLEDVALRGVGVPRKTLPVRRKLSKEFDWMRSLDMSVVNENVPFDKIETKFSDLEDSVFVYSTELDNAEKVLVDVREKLDNAMCEDGTSLALSPGKLDETFIVEENMINSPLPPSSACQHKYEVGVVAISVTEECLQLVGPLNNIWVRTEVRPSEVSVYVRGGRITDSLQVHVGDIGTLVSGLCVRCQLDKTTECLATPLLLWFGEELKPNVRGVQGVVVWREEDIFLVQLDTPLPVLFRGCKEDDGVKVGCEVLVWACSKPGTCAEGVAWIQATVTRQQVQDGDEKQALVRRDSGLACENLDLSTSSIFSPVGGSFEDMACVRPTRFSVENEYSDKGSDISFGSVSECDGIDLNKSFNTNISILINSTPTNNNKLNSQEEEFQNLYSGAISPILMSVDIDLQFEQVLTANGLVDNYDNLARKYEDFFQASQRPSIISKPAAAKLITSYLNSDQSFLLSPQRIFLERNPTEVPSNPSFTRRIPCPPLSPIPEESNENCSEVTMLSTPLYRAGDDSGFNDTFSSGNRTYNTSGTSVSSVEKIPASALFKRVAGKEVLEQFLEFTKFPATTRDDLIDQFAISQSNEAF